MVKKKLKSVADLLSSKRVQQPAQATPSTPKKDTRGWSWRTPRRPQNPSSSAPSETTQPLPSLFSLLAAALSPRSKSDTRAPLPTQAPSSDVDPVLDDISPAFDFLPTLSPLATPGKGVAAAIQTTSFGVSPQATYRQPTVQDADVDTVDSRLDGEDEEDPDDQDGVDGNYHNVRRFVSAME